MQDGAALAGQDTPWLPALKLKTGVVAFQTRHWNGIRVKKRNKCVPHPLQSRNSVGLMGQVRQGAHTPLGGLRRQGPRTQNQAGLRHSAGRFCVEGLHLVLKELRKGSSQGLLI